MNNKQESRLSMYFTVKEYLASYTTITNALPNFSANATILYNAIPQLQAISELQKTSKKGITANKKQLRLKVEEIANDYVRKLTAYAVMTNDTKLAAEVNLSESKLRQASDTAIKDYAQLLYSRAQSNLASLVTYLITAASQTAFQTAITNYNTTIGKPGASRSESKQVTKQLEPLFAAAEKAIKLMDTAVEIVKATQLNFYNGYQSARRVIETGVGKLAVQGLVTEVDNKTPIKGVGVTIVAVPVPDDAQGPNNPTPKIEKKTADKGGFNVKSMANGSYVVTLKKAGYDDQTVTISVNNGELTNVRVSMRKK